jgi:hypothetical protein
VADRIASVREEPRERGARDVDERGVLGVVGNGRSSTAEISE